MDILDALDDSKMLNARKAKLDTAQVHFEHPGALSLQSLSS